MCFKNTVYAHLLRGRIQTELEMQGALSKAPVQRGKILFPRKATMFRFGHFPR